MSKRDSHTNPPSFEQSIARLEEIIARIEHPETGLEETIALTAEGNRLIRNSRKLLEQAELKIQALSAPEETPAKASPRTADSPEKGNSPSSPQTLSPAPDDHGFSLF